MNIRLSASSGSACSGVNIGKVCYLGGLCYVSNTLHVCTMLQQHYGTSLLYEQGHSAEVLGKTVVQLGFKQSSVDKTLFGRDRFIKKLIGVVVLPF